MNETSGIGRRDFGGALAASASLLLVGCNGGSGNGPSVDSEFSALANTISSLVSTVGRLKTEECKDVVPDLESDTAGVSAAFANLKAAMGKP